MSINTRLLLRSYPPPHGPVNGTLGCLAMLATVAALTVVPTASQVSLDEGAACSDQLRHRFAPADPDGVNRFIVCRSSRAIEELASPQWTALDTVVDDAFPGVAPSVRRALALLYKGRRLQIVRGWRTTAGGLEAVTLIAPPPDDAVTRLTSGTMIVIGRYDR